MIRLGYYLGVIRCQYSADPNGYPLQMYVAKTHRCTVTHYLQQQTRSGEFTDNRYWRFGRSDSLIYSQQTTATFSESKLLVIATFELSK